jgi:hypothetical protein
MNAPETLMRINNPAQRVCGWCRHELAPGTQPATYGICPPVLPAARAGREMERRRVMAFDLETFPEQFEEFLDTGMPADDELLTIDRMHDVLRSVREYLNEQQAPTDFQRELVDLIIRPWLMAQIATGEERVEMQRKWSTAVGFEIQLLN